MPDGGCRAALGEGGAAPAAWSGGGGVVLRRNRAGRQHHREAARGPPVGGGESDLDGRHARPAATQGWSGEGGGVWAWVGTRRFYHGDQERIKRDARREGDWVLGVIPSC